MTDAQTCLEERVLILPPSAKDGAITQKVLREDGMACDCVRNIEQLCDELDRGAGVVLLAEEVVTLFNLAPLVEWVKAQPTWSEIPFVVLAHSHSDSTLNFSLFETLGNVALLQRPTRVAALLAMVRLSLRARRKQYEVRDHLIERQRAAELLDERDRMKDQFLAVLGHELRNPLSALNAAIVLQSSGNAPPETKQEATAIMEAQVKQLTRLLNDLSDASRIARGKLKLEREVRPLLPVLEDALQTMRATVAENGQRLVYQVEDGLSLHVVADASRLQQVFTNLIANAAKYSNEGSTITVSVARFDAACEVRVRDDGIGIAPEHLDQLFVPFFQIEESLDRSRGGLGIGLALVRQILDLHDASISARSDGLGKGSEFIVRLPLVEATPPTPPAKDRREHPPAARRLLVVDDNRVCLKMMDHLLQSEGHSVATAPTGQKAIQRFEQQGAEVVVLDVGLPDKSGWEVASEIRKLPNGEEALIIVLSGYAQPEDIARSAEAGCDLHLAKPVDMNELLAAIDGFTA